MNVGFTPRLPQAILPHQRTAETNIYYLPDAVPEYNEIASNTQHSHFGASLSAVARDGVLVDDPVSHQPRTPTSTSSVETHDDIDLDQLCSFLLSPDLVVTPELEEQIGRALDEGPSEETGHVETQAAEPQDTVGYVPASQPAAVLHSQAAVNSTPECTDTATPFIPSHFVVHDAPASIQTEGPSPQSTHEPPDPDTKKVTQTKKKRGPRGKYNKQSPGWDLSGYNAQIAPQRAIDVRRLPLTSASGGKRRVRSEEDEGRGDSVGPVTKKRKSDTPRGVTAEGDVAATANHQPEP